MKNLCIRAGKFFVKNIKQIITAIVLSIIIWFAVSIQIFPNVTDHVDNINLTVTNTAFMNEENLVVSTNVNRTVSVQVYGKRYDIGNLTSEDFYAYLDLSSIFGAGKHIVPVVVETVDNIDCDITSENQFVTIEVKKIVKKELPVIANVDAVSVEDGFKIDTDTITVTPSVITIEGEESVVNSVERAEVKALTDNVLSATTAVKGELVLYNKSGGILENPDITINQNEFTINIPVYKVNTLPLSVQFTNYPSNFDIDSISYSIYPSEITIGAPDSATDNLETIDIGEVSLSDLTVKDFQGGITLTISLPEGYQNISGNKTALITFENNESYGSLEFTVPSENFTITNQPSNFNVSFLTNQVSVCVVGPSDVLLNMSSADISLNVNLLGVELTEGTKTITANFKLAGSKTKAWVSGEYKVDLNITVESE